MGIGHYSFICRHEFFPLCCQRDFVCLSETQNIFETESVSLCCCAHNLIIVVVVLVAFNYECKYIHIYIYVSHLQMIIYYHR